MRLGDCFLLRDRTIDGHLHVVISDPEKNPNKVLLASITTRAPHKEAVCLFNANEHIWIKHQSCVSFAHAKLVPLSYLNSIQASGQLEMQPPFDNLMLRRIWGGALESEDLAMECADLLAEQGFIDL